MTRHFNKVVRPRRRRGGATVIEAAIVLPVALMGLLLMLDLGMAIAQSNSLSDCARHAARLAIVRGARSAEPLGPATWTGTLGDTYVLADAVRPRLLAMPPDQVQLFVTWPDDANRTGSRIRVRLQYEHPPILAGLSGALELTSESVMRIHR